MEEKNLQVIVCDHHKRISGVSTTIRSQLTRLDKRLKICFWAYTSNGNIKGRSFKETYEFIKEANGPVIFHARRNCEMVRGLILKYIYRRPLKLFFTSAAQRRHSWFPRLLINHMDHVISTTKKAALFLERESAVIGHGVDTDVFVPIRNIEEAKKRLKLNHKFGVSIVGRIRPEKGTDVFVKSLISVMKKKKDVDAYLFGLVTSKHKTFAESLKKEIEEAGLFSRFHWMGEIAPSKMSDYLGVMDVLCAPAKYEGYGVVPLEAMACKTVVCATDTGAYKQMIDEGKTGFIIKDENDLSDRILELLDAPEKLERMKEAALKKVKKEFSLEKEVDSLIKEYLKSLN